jgi:hypothetical protein
LILCEFKGSNLSNTVLVGIAGSDI